MSMIFNHYSEKSIKINISNKVVLVSLDLLSDIVEFFAKPFDGTEIPV